MTRPHDLPLKIGSPASYAEFSPAVIGVIPDTIWSHVIVMVPFLVPSWRRWVPGLRGGRL